MVVVDTDIVSELMRSEPNPSVLTWLDRRPTRELFVTAVTEAEILAGIAFLPMGARRRGLAEAAGHAFGGLFAGRVLPFDSAAARVYAEIAAMRRAAGRSACPGRRPDRGDRPVAQHSGRDAQCPGLRGRGRRGRRSLDGGVTSTDEARARVGIDTLLQDMGWSLTGDPSVLFEHAHSDGTQADYMLCDRAGSSHDNTGS